MRKRFFRTGRPRAMVMAVVLGAALGGSARAAGTAPPDERAVQDISRYCQVCWRNARLPQDAWPDCTQEVFTRLLERVETRRWDQVLNADGEERREFLRAVDAVKKRVQRRRTCQTLPGDVRDHRGDDANRTWETVEHAADKVLSPRQRRILSLSREGWAVPEIAEKLTTTPERVSDEKYKALRKLRRHFGGESA
ncbi:MAG TPA: sigma factor-like helix-turn-helix DNA-binding protein [Gemmataceae bacterium]